MEPIFKYPRTHHVQGSRLQPGDEDLQAVPFAALAGRHLVVEEKMDGANAGVSFGPDGELRLQSRGHYLTGGGRERHFDLFKRWAAAHEGSLREALGRRYVLFGEWLHARHTVFYDRLPHLFMEFDLYDRQDRAFLDTPTRARRLARVPLSPVRVLHEGPLASLEQLTDLLGPSAFIAEGHTERLRASAEALGLDPARALSESDPTTLMEGLYIKVEEGGEVTARYKFVRHGFLSAVARAEGHWQRRPIIPNQLRDDVDIFAPGDHGPEGSHGP